MKKECNRCLVTKQIEYFPKNIKNKGGYLNQCKKCVRIAVLKWKLENSILVKERRKATYLKDRKKNINNSIEWGRKNKEKRKVAKDRWRSKNKDLTNHYTKNYIYRKKGAVGSHSKKEFDDKKEIFNGLCAYCCVKIGNTKDHIIPLSKGGTNFIDNILPACVGCNSSKRDKLLSEWKGLIK